MATLPLKEYDSTASIARMPLEERGCSQDFKINLFLNKYLFILLFFKLSLYHFCERKEKSDGILFPG